MTTPDELLARGRAAAEALLRDRFAAFAPTGESDTDADGMETPLYEPKGHAFGKIQARSREGNTNARTVTVAGVTRDVVEGGLHIAVSAPAPAAGDFGDGWEYVLTAPGPSTPPDLLGSRWLVVNSPAKSYMTTRRLDVVRLP